MFKKLATIVFLLALCVPTYAAQGNKGPTQTNLESQLKAAREENAFLKKANADLESGLEKVRMLNTQLKAQTKELYYKGKDTAQGRENIRNTSAIANAMEAELLAMEKVNRDQLQRKAAFLKARELEQADFKSQLKAAKEEGAFLKRANETLQYELERRKDLNNKLEMKVKELYIKSKDLEQTKEDNKKLSKLGDSMNAEITSLKKANEELAHDNFAFQETTRREKAALYKELGTAYTQLKLFDMAIASYEKSLSLNPDDGEAHYNAALLYRGIREDSLRAIQHLGEAWRLTDDPKKKQDIEYMTKMLKEKSFLKEWNAGHS